MPPSVVLLAARTARSQAYAQALQQAGILLSNVVIFGNRGLGLPSQIEAVRKQTALPGLVVPDLSIALEDTCATAKWRVSHLACNDVNEPQIASYLHGLKPDLVIYSGYGSQIVGEPVLRAAAPFLHVHSGWLPAYRGSTTLYYSWLETGTCGVSAFIMDSGIDTGPIIARKMFPPPPPDVEVDYIYDSAIRANVLVDVIISFFDGGVLPAPISVREQGFTYFVIHPVLKHIALLTRTNASSSTKGTSALANG